jgi:hypothetical protein
MIVIALAFFALNALALLVLPRRWAPVPLIITACYTTRIAALDLGPFTFTVLRLLVMVGLFRMVTRGERFEGGLTALDRLVIFWGLWDVASVAFHANPASQLVLRLRQLLDAWGMYFLFRTYCRSWDDVGRLASVLALAIAPIAMLMLLERVTGFNPFSVLGASEFATIREGTGEFRARGPFHHPILAGTLGAVCLPLCLGIWQSRRTAAVIGALSSFVIVYSSGSSGPVLAMLAGIMGLALWPLRSRMYLVRWAAVLCYIGLEIVMNRPVYYLTTSLGGVGSGSGWFRARLIDSAIRHLDEWWLFGTDYTRHWMSTGVAWSSDQADITNHYIGLGVSGGLLLVAIFVAMLTAAFFAVGRAQRAEPSPDSQFLIWSVGAALFAHVATCMSVSYYDQSVFFLYVTFAATCALPSAVAVAVPDPATKPKQSHRMWNPDFQLGRAGAANVHAFRTTVTNGRAVRR